MRTDAIENKLNIFPSTSEVGKSTLEEMELHFQEIEIRLGLTEKNHSDLEGKFETHTGFFMKREHIDKERFQEIEENFRLLKDRLITFEENVEERFEGIEQRLNHMEEIFEKRLDGIESLLLKLQPLLGLLPVK